MLHALGGILLQAVPTFLLILFLHFYLKSIFFKPLEKVLKARFEATEGARNLAEQSLARATAKAEQYEKSLYAAQGEIFQAQDKALRTLHESHATAVAEARANADAQIKRAKADLAAEAASIKQKLEAETNTLADRIAETVLRRSAA